MAPPALVLTLAIAVAGSAAVAKPGCGTEQCSASSKAPAMRHSGSTLLQLQSEAPVQKNHTSLSGAPMACETVAVSTGVKDGYYLCPGNKGSKVFFSKNSFHTNPCSPVGPAVDHEGNPVEKGMAYSSGPGVDFDDQQVFMVALAREMCTQGLSLYLDFADTGAGGLKTFYDLNKGKELEFEPAINPKNGKEMWPKSMVASMNLILQQKLSGTDKFIYIPQSVGAFCQAEQEGWDRQDSFKIDGKVVTRLSHAGDAKGLAQAIAACFMGRCPM